MLSYALALLLYFALFEINKFYIFYIYIGIWWGERGSAVSWGTMIQKER
jgi:hypothetical protein